MRLTPDAVRSLTLGKLFKENTKPVNAIDFHREGEFLVTSSDDESIRVYNVDNGSEHKMVNSKKYGVDLIKFTRHTNTVLCASKNSHDQTLRYLSLHDNRFLRYFKGHRERVVSIALSPTDDSFMSASLDETVRLWDMRTGPCQGLLRVKGRSSVAFDPEGKVLAVALGGGVIKLYDVRSFDKGPFEGTQVELERVDGDAAPLSQWTGMRFSPDGRFMLLSTDQAPVYLLDSFNLGKIHAYRGRQNVLSTPIPASFSPDGKFVSSGSEDGSVLIWDTESAELVHRMEGGHPELPTVADSDAPPLLVEWNPARFVIATSCSTLGLWVPQILE